MDAPDPYRATLARWQVTERSTPLPDIGERADSPRVFLECTSTFFSRYNTGIQRASRNLVDAALAARGSGACSAIVYNGRYFVSIDALPERPAHALRPSPVDILRETFHRARAGAIRVLPGASVRDALHSQRLEYSLRRIVHALQNATRWLHSFGAGEERRVVFRRGDVLVLLDPAWSIDLSFELRRARAAGARIWIVVNDLIPIAYPDLAPEGSAIMLERWLRRVTPYAEGMLAISRTVASELRTYLAQMKLVATPPRIEYFYLGAGLGQIEAEPPRVALQTIFRGAPVYLTVGTIEPRKNHALILDVFDRMWAEGVDTKLMIFGRLGWRSHGLELRIRAHPQFGRRLLWLDAGSDTELDYAYRHASALIFASRCEGFGLPLVEAMQYGLRVFASDIPVFREIGADFPVYFDPDDKWMLYDAIRSFEAALAQGEPATRTARAWPSWSESARVLLEKVCDRSRFEHSPYHT